MVFWVYRGQIIIFMSGFCYDILKTGIGINIYSPDICPWDINVSIQTQSIIDAPQFKVVTGGF